MKLYCRTRRRRIASRHGAMMDGELVDDGPVTLLIEISTTHVDFRPARSTHG
jgi:hypothetical protein